MDDPHHIPPDAELVLVDWSERRPDWAEALQPTAGRRVIVFGPHTDLEAHADARAAGLGPMWARSKLLGTLPEVLGEGAIAWAETRGLARLTEAPTPG